MRLPPGLLLLERTGGWLFSLAVSIVWMLGMVWPEVVAGAAAGVVEGAADACAPGCAWASGVDWVGDLS
jgi:hypothetical protein